jgi:hypothetical protein
MEHEAADPELVSMEQLGNREAISPVVTNTCNDYKMRGIRKVLQQLRDKGLRRQTNQTDCAKAKLVLGGNIYLLDLAG